MDSIILHRNRVDSADTEKDFRESTVIISTFNSRQYLQSLEISKQISCVLRGIKRAISRKLVKISDYRMSSFFKTVPGCQVSRQGVFKNGDKHKQIQGCK